MRHRAVRRRLPAWAPALTGAAMLAPIAAGLAGTALPAFGYLPAIGGNGLTFEPWRALLATPGFATSVRLTLQTGIAATLLSLALAIGFCAWAQRYVAWQRLVGFVAPLLATPHSALAIGLAFLLAPSGWLVRLAQPWIGATPPDVATIADAQGFALIAALVLKETPFLVLMIQSALAQVAEPRARLLARSLGYAPADGWLKTILPQIYPQIRLPVYAVLAFSLSVVDMALIIGPSHPPTLSVLALRDFSDADVRHWFRGAAAASLLFMLALAAIAGWRLGERAVRSVGLRWIERGRRGRASTVLAAAASGIASAAYVIAMLAIAGLAVWSLARQWRFPAAWPASLTLDNWATHQHAVGASALATLGIGIAATAIALALTLACLESESRRRSAASRLLQRLIYLPLLVPQIAFLFGIDVLFVQMRMDGSRAAVVGVHVLFVLPYVYLALADPWRALDPRYARSAAALGASPARIFARVKMPLLLRPVLIACSIGFAVSVGQYLPTLFAGAGRVATLTTDAVTLASGADRRVVAVYAVLQALLPLAAYLAAAGVPAWRHANRRERLQMA